MKEDSKVTQMNRPNTRATLRQDFAHLGLKEGDIVLVHTSLSSMGWVCGGTTAVIQALIDVVGEGGTIVMPTQTGDNSDPCDWGNPPMPEQWWPIIREQMPAFEPDVTPSRGMGKIAEAFRSYPGVKRSNHPTYSFAAWGKYADAIVSEQSLEAGFGSSSPLAKMYDLNAVILLLGVGHDSNTSLHFAEHDVKGKPLVQKGTALLENGERVWKTYEEIDYDADCFEDVGKDFEKTHHVNQATIGLAPSKLMKQRAMIDFARVWLNNKQVKQ
ncbi:aminoglycoside N(3)-acetyltransferase [Aquibacillus sediminis]|uniref:aminoglycoside N(3)-acetyltransferase n=1 Tax=Aquibacillus sediminis TaxID=2574734 RepID=UPI001109F0AA|nr:AAC(3) family N-acetyltransferase [Aquibacillus sediminis]